MRKTWVVVADEGLARILEVPENGGDLIEVETLSDSAARADGADLRRDAHGRRAGSGTLASSYPTASAGEDELHQEADSFARRLSQWLTEALRAQRYEALRIAAAPRFLGLLRKALNADVANVVVEDLDKDLIHLSLRELTQRVGAPARRPLA